MLWIKRNLFVVVGGLGALVLLAFGGFYLFSSINKNKELETALDAKKHDLENIYKQKPFPSSANIAAVRVEQKKVKVMVGQMQQFFAPIPVEKVTGMRFRTLLEQTVSFLQKKAESSGVKLPSKTYEFSFHAQMDKVSFASGSFPALPEQLAEIKVFSDILFGAKINRLVNLRRARVSADDPPGSSDYHEYKGEKTSLVGTASSFYEASFQCFSPELAALLESFSKSAHGFIVKTVTVDGTQVADPAAAMQALTATKAVVAPAAQPGIRAPGKPAGPGARPKEEARTVLNEKLLKVTLLVELIKPALPAK